MTTIDNHTDASENDSNVVGLSSFLAAVRDIVQNHAADLNTSVFQLEVDQKQLLLDTINPYLMFELSQSAGIKGLPVEVQGTGMMFISSIEGELLGAEQISDGDTVTGIIDDVCAYPVPTTECLFLGDEGGMPIIDESLSGVIMLKNVTYKSGLNKNGIFEVEHDLGAFQIGLPLAHYLRFKLFKTKQQSAP